MSEDESKSLQEDILSLIFSNKLQEDWREDPNVHSYLSELSTYGVHKLASEPARLLEEKSLLQDQIQDLTFSHYKTFIQAAQCSREIVSEFGKIESSLQSLRETLPSFKEKCHQFESGNREISSRWRETSLALSKHPQLLEVLEVPQLMETCVRNGHYEEALELAAFVRRLARRHAASIPLIQNIQEETERCLQLMLNQLLLQLGSTIQLASCMKVVGYLRRLGIFSEPQLRIKFLQTRDAWFKGLLKAIPKVDGYTHISKTMDLTRVHLFDIITQYRATFSDEDPLGSGSIGGILPSWVALKVAEFLVTLEEDLSRPDVAERLGTLLGSAMFFGLSCSRVGADIRGLMVPIFHQAALRHFSGLVCQATEKFQKSMESFTLAPQPYFHSASMLSRSLDSSLQGDLMPPESILEFPLLVHYLNSILGAFNILRQCCPLALAAAVTALVKQSLHSVAQAIAHFSQAEEQSLTPKEREVLSSLCLRYSQDLVPHLDVCLQALYPLSEMAPLLGLSQADCTRLDLTRLDSCSLSEPLQHLILDETLNSEDHGIVFGDHVQPKPPDEGMRLELSNAVATSEGTIQPTLQPSQQTSVQEDKTPEPQDPQTSAATSPGYIEASVNHQGDSMNPRSLQDAASHQVEDLTIPELSFSQEKSSEENQVNIKNSENLPYPRVEGSTNPNPTQIPSEDHQKDVTNSENSPYPQDEGSTNPEPPIFQEIASKGHQEDATNPEGLQDLQDENNFTNQEASTVPETSASHQESATELLEQPSRTS